MDVSFKIRELDVTVEPEIEFPLQIVDSEKLQQEGD